MTILRCAGHPTACASFDAPVNTTQAATACNPEAAEQGGVIALLLALACLGYVAADVAADGLTVSYAQREPEETRGYTQSTVYLVRSCGMMSAICLVGFGMNCKEYNVRPTPPSTSPPPPHRPPPSPPSRATTALGAAPRGQRHHAAAMPWKPSCVAHPSSRSLPSVMTDGAPLISRLMTDGARFISRLMTDGASLISPDD